MEREKDDDILSETNEESANITQDEETQPERTEDELKNIEVETKQWIDKVNNGKLRRKSWMTRMKVKDTICNIKKAKQVKEKVTNRYHGNKTNKNNNRNHYRHHHHWNKQQQQQQQQYNRSLKQPGEPQEIAQHEKQQNVLPKPGQIVTQQAEHKHHHHQQQQQQQHEKDKVEKELNILQKTPVRVPQPQQYPEP